MALSKNRIKYIRSLELKKNRKADKVFLAEGPKLVGDLLGHFRCRFLIATAEWLSAPRQLPVEDITEVSEKELSCASLLKTPQQVLAVFEQPDEVMDASVVAHSLCLALDDVQDPGNLGTMFRTAEGAGMSGVVLSSGCVDLFNPKVVRSTMGAMFRVPFYICESMSEEMKQLQNQSFHFYAAHLQGKKNFREETYDGRIGILIGNEANGLSDEVTALADKKVIIPMEGELESLNAAVSAALLMYEVQRNR